MVEQEKMTTSQLHILPPPGLEARANTGKTEPPLVPLKGEGIAHTEWIMTKSLFTTTEVAHMEVLSLVVGIF